MSLVISRSFLPGLILASISYVLCFPEWNYAFCSIFVMPFFLISGEKIRNFGQAVLAGLIFSSIVAIGGFSWITYTIQNYGGFPFPVALGFLAIFCPLAAPQAYFFFYLFYRYRNYVLHWSSFNKSLLWAGLYTSLEFVFRFVKIFPEHLGNTIGSWSLPLAQLASVGGVSILTFLPLFVGACLYFGAQKKSREGAFAAIFGTALLLVAYFWGTWEMNRLKKLSPDETLNIALIQANIGDLVKIASESGNSEALQKVVNQYLSQTQESVAQSIDLVIWPETAYPLSFPTEPESKKTAGGMYYANLMRSGLENLGVPILFGGYEAFGGRDYNSMILLRPDTSWAASYRKDRLLIFGEYMPLGDIFPALKSLNPMLGDFGRGGGPKPIRWERPGKDDILIGSNICYEAIMPDFVHGYAKAGAHMLVNVTNDSWFGPTQEPHQHLQLAQLRAIENRLPFVRATNTGISTGFNFTGEQLNQGPLFKSENIYLSIPIFKTPPFALYREYGEFFAWALVILVIFALGRIEFTKEDP